MKWTGVFVQVIGPYEEREFSFTFENRNEFIAMWQLFIEEMSAEGWFFHHSIGVGDEREDEQGCEGDCTSKG